MMPRTSLSDFVTTITLPNEHSTSRELYAALTRIIDVAAGNDHIDTRPEARMHDAKTMRAASLAEHTEMWEKFIAPNTSLPDSDKASMLKQIQFGINWEEYANHTAFEGSNNAKHYEKNKPVTGTLLDGVTRQEDFIDTTIKSYLDMGALREVGPDEPTVISPLFVDTSRPKGRLITDVRWQNKRQTPPPFKLQTLSEFRRAIKPGSLMFKIDLVAGFLHVGISERSQSVFGIRWKASTYVFTAANFGANTTPFIFQRLTASVGEVLQRLGISNCVYLDDMLYVCLPGTETRSARQRAEDTIFVVKEVMFLCGFVVHPEKSVLTATTRIESLGFGIDSILQTFWILPHRLASIVTLARELEVKRRITLNEMQRFTGKAVSLTLAAPAIRLYLGPLWDSLAHVRHDHIMVDETIKDALAEFTEGNVNRWGRLARWRPEEHKTAELYGDAAGGSSITENLSRNGWGVKIYTPDTPGPRTLKGRFDPQHWDEPINVKECLASTYGLRAAGFHNCFAKIFTDNTDVYFAMKKFSTKTKAFRPFVRSCVEFQVDNNVVLEWEWIPSHLNPADAPSRDNDPITDLTPPDPADVMLRRQIFEEVQAWAGLTCTLDCLATPQNTQTPQFISRRPSNDPGCVGVDVFTCRKTLRSNTDTTGEQHVLWVHPPWAIISALWSFLEASETRGIFVIPHTASAGWFARMLHQAVKATRIATKGEENTYLSHGRGVHPDRWEAAKVDLYAVVFDFRLKM